MSVAVYRLYDSDENLLYVGQSNWPERRIYKHSTKTWGKDIARSEMDWYESRDEALAAERRLLESHRPLHNVQHARYAEHVRSDPTCRCKRCRTRSVNTVKKYRQKRLGTEPPEHGVISSYVYYGCRCDPCREVKNASDRARYRRLRGAA